MWVEPMKWKLVNDVMFEGKTLSKPFIHITWNGLDQPYFEARKKKKKYNGAGSPYSLRDRRKIVEGVPFYFTTPPAPPIKSEREREFDGRDR